MGEVGLVPAKLDTPELPPSPWLGLGLTVLVSFELGEALRSAELRVGESVKDVSQAEQGSGESAIAPQDGLLHFMPPFIASVAKYRSCLNLVSLTYYRGLTVSHIRCLGGRIQQPILAMAGSKMDSNNSHQECLVTAYL